jgi:hypothetical protein
MYPLNPSSVLSSPSLSISATRKVSPRGIAKTPLGRRTILMIEIDLNGSIRNPQNVTLGSGDDSQPHLGFRCVGVNLE